LHVCSIHCVQSLRNENSVLSPCVDLSRRLSNHGDRARHPYIHEAPAEGKLFTTSVHSDYAFGDLACRLYRDGLDWFELNDS